MPSSARAACICVLLTNAIIAWIYAASLSLPGGASMAYRALSSYSPHSYSSESQMHELPFEKFP
jgi:hypothetical protein